jgi:hypothetical protein
VGTALSVAAILIALAAAFFTGIAALAAWRQTQLQREIARDAAQPYVWADLRADDAQGGLLMLLLGNSGRTVATNVRITTDPRLVDHATHADRTRPVPDQIARGISSLAPGRTMRWHLGALRDHLEKGIVAQRYVIRIEADGPFGPVPPLEYTIDLEDIRVTKRLPEGSMHLVAEAIRESSKHIATSLDALPRREASP